MSVSNWALGNAIRTARIQKGYTQEQLSELLEITPSHLKMMEGGRRNPSVPLLFQMMALLDFSVDALVFPGPGEGGRPPHRGADGAAGGGPVPADRRHEGIKQRLATRAQTAVLFLFWPRSPAAPPGPASAWRRRQIPGGPPRGCRRPGGSPSRRRAAAAGPGTWPWPPPRCRGWWP